MKIRNLALTVLSIFLFSSATQAQSTWDSIYTILNTNCTSIIGGCHEQGSSNPAFNVQAPADTLYASLINGIPVNPYAKDSANNKIVDPGSPQTSYLMRKLAYCDTSSGSVLQLKQPFEGAAMPEGGNRLPDSELELIYTWIVAGAPDTGIVSPDSVTGDICDLNVGIRILPGSNISFTAFPNPATNNFSCSYTLNDPSLVKMDLLDVSGKKVKTVFNGYQNPGTQTKTIKSDNLRGTYFIKLTIGNSSVYVKKIALY